MSITDTIKNAKLGANRINPVPTNAPYNSGPLSNHWGTEAAYAYQLIGAYAGNVFEAEIQGLDYDNFYEWQKVLLRSAPVVDATTGDNMSEDWQRIMIIDRKIDFIPVGAYVRYNNNVWIVFNPDNVTQDIGTAVVQRCNTTYNNLDFYGNIVKTPMSMAKGKILASSPYYMEYSAIMDGYGHVLLQYNENTKELHDNTRVLLGNSAYSFYGVVNFAQEFTDNEDSVHIIKADLRVNEIVENDDRENRVADGNAFRFTIEIGGINHMPSNGTQQLTAEFFRNGEKVVDSTEHPLDVMWETSDESVAEIDSNGEVTSVGAGECTITATLVQNPNIKEEFSLEVESPLTDGVQFIGNVPESAPVFTSFPVEAAYFQNGERSADPVVFEIAGVPGNAVTLNVVDGNNATVDVWTASGTLYLSAVHGQDAALAKIVLEGF